MGEGEGKGDGEVLGTVTDLIHGGNDLLEVALIAPEGRRVLIPFVEAFVDEVSLESRQIRVDWGADF